jgi:Leucine-rich repeat (LRR) protein
MKPNNLQTLCCPNNKLLNIPILPISVKFIDISGNNIKSISNELLNCRNLKKINISNNPLELTIQQQNFIIWINERNRQIINRYYFKDEQNVHNSSVQKSIRKSIENLMNFQ